MKIFYLISILIFLKPVFAQESTEWKTISNILSQCPDFTLEYNIVSNQDGKREYQIRSSRNRERVYPIYLKDLKEQSFLESSFVKDFFLNEIKYYCGDNLKKLFPTYGESCLIDPEVPIFDSDAGNILFKIMSFVVAGENDCRDFEELSNLTRMEEVREWEKERAKKNKKGEARYSSILKESAKDLENFLNCGSKKSSEVFVRNTILMQTRLMCFYPNPEGALSFDEAYKIADEIASEYKNKKVLKLAKSSDEISRKVSMRFVDEIASKSLVDMFSEDGKLIHKNEKYFRDIVKNSSNYKHYKNIIDKSTSYKTKNKKINLQEHNLKYAEVLSLDMTFELAERILPDLVESNFLEKLPATWGSEKKEEHLQTKLIPKIQKSYESCIKDLKKELNIRTNFNDSRDYSEILDEDRKMVEEREKMKCENKPDLCREHVQTGCEASVYRRGGDDKHSDMAKIQACMYGAFAETAFDIVDISIDDGIENLKESTLKNKEETKLKVNKLAKQKLSLCIDSETKDKTNGPFFEKENTAFENKELLDTDSFAKIMSKCADEVSYVAIREIMQDALMEKFAPEYDGMRDKALNEVESILDTTYKECSMSLKDKEKDYTLCSAAVEIEASSRFVENKIEKTLNDFFSEKKKKYPKEDWGKFNREKEGIIAKFKECANNKRKDYVDMAESYKVKFKDPNYSYLDAEEGNGFYKECVQNAISSSSTLMSPLLYKEKIATPDVKDKNYSLALSKDVTALISSCLKDELNTRTPNWTSFVTENEKKEKPTYFDIIEEACSKKAEVFVLPKILNHEAEIALLSYVNDGYLKQEENNYQVGNALALTADKLRRLYNIDKKNYDASKDGSFLEWSIAESLKKHLKSEKSSESFQQLFTEDLTLKAFNFVHKNLFKKTSDKGGRNFSEFENALSPQCFKDIYGIIEKDKSFTLGRENKTSKNESLLDKLSDYLAEGFLYANKVGKGRVNDVVQSIKNVCNGLDKGSIKNLNDLLQPIAPSSVGLLDFIIKAKIYNSAKETLKKQFDDSIEIDREIYKNKDFYLEKRKPFIDEKEKALKEIFEKYIEDPATFEKYSMMDMSLIPYARSNFSKLVSGNSLIEGNIKEKLVNNLFSDPTKDSFADKFAKITIETSVGLGGFDKAIKDADGVLINYSTEARKVWDPKNISEKLEWDKMANRTKIIEQIKDFALTSIKDNYELKIDNKISQDEDKLLINDLKKSFQATNKVEGKNIKYYVIKDNGSKNSDIIVSGTSTFWKKYYLTKYITDRLERDKYSDGTSFNDRIISLILNANEAEKRKLPPVYDRIKP